VSGSTLDERIARDCARSGVPFFVADDALLERVAEWAELAWTPDDDMATPADQGRGAGSVGSASTATKRKRDARPNSKGPSLTNRDLRKTTPRTTEEVVAS
jgi:hypothetical protein